jgi:hypothetical protein
MIDHLKTPAAWAKIAWLSEAQGGRRTGPPTAPVYASTCAFPLGDEAEMVPGWPDNREDFSVLIEKLAVEDDATWLCALDFLARDLVADKIRRGSRVLVFEGRKIVATGLVTEVDEEVLSAEQ